MGLRGFSDKEYSHMRMAGHTPWGEIKHKRDEREQTERTPKGYEVPVPKRGEFFANLEKITKNSSATGRPSKDR